MRSMNDDYEPISDWSREGRRRLVAKRRDYILLLLDAAFSDLVDEERDLSLAAFGFRSEDSVEEAILWSLERFENGDLDPAQILPSSRSFRLFTEAHFWLAQKAGRGYRRLIGDARGTAQVARNREPTGSVGAESDLNEARLAFGQELVTTLQVLLDRTCADMVGFWLHGTKRFRRDVFGWPSQAELSGAAASSSRKQKSLHAHDAMFRFLCCFFALVPAKPEAHAERALELTCLSGCPNKAPYRVDDRDVVESLAAPGVHGPRPVGALRKQGAADFLRRCLERAQHEAEVGREQLAVLLTRRTISPTTLHALSIEKNEALKTLIQIICERADEEGTT